MIDQSAAPTKGKKREPELGSPDLAYSILQTAKPVCED